MGWTNTQAENVDGLAVTYTNTTILYSTASALSLAADATFSSETDLELADADLEITRVISTPTVGMIQLIGAVPLDMTNERIIDSRDSDDAIAPFVVFGKGRLEWGSGGASGRDTTMQRIAGGGLALDGRTICSSVANFAGPATVIAVGGAYANVNGTVTFDKAYGAAASNARVDFSASNYSDTANQGTNWAVTFDGGAPQQIGFFHHNLANVHAMASGSIIVTGLAAGSYTVRLQMMQASGVGFAWQDLNDWTSVICSEVSV